MTADPLRDRDRDQDGERDRNRDRNRLVEAAAEAAEGVPGVAFLRPGVVDLLRTRVADRAPRLATGPGPRTQGVRVSRDSTTGIWHIDLRLVLHRGHRALDVTRAVHTATLAATRAEPSVSVRVTVTGVV
ncbi:Asp23/Gls24 family envelope stress response protein [Streptomyces bacillaris]|uniref:Asp23/Gls24 family envelope stress response protein n=1 Tax=Streptomyces bacillaris TaxID=68179 RepID=UPI003674273C